MTTVIDDYKYNWKFTVPACLGLVAGTMFFWWCDDVIHNYLWALPEIIINITEGGCLLHKVDGDHSYSIYDTPVASQYSLAPAEAQG